MPGCRPSPRARVCGFPTSACCGGGLVYGRAHRHFSPTLPTARYEEGDGSYRAAWVNPAAIGRPAWVPGVVIRVTSTPEPQVTATTLLVAPQRTVSGKPSWFLPMGGPDDDVVSDLNDLACLHEAGMVQAVTVRFTKDLMCVRVCGCVTVWLWLWLWLWLCSVCIVR